MVMKKTIFALMLAFVATAVFAQKEDMADRRAEMIQKRATGLVKSMKLTDEDEAWFTSLYTEYQDSLMNLRQALRPEGQPEEVNGMKEMKKYSDEQIQEMIANQFTMEEKQVAVKRAYYEKFAERLTPRQLMMVFMGPGINGARQRGAQQPGGDHMRGGFPGGPGGFGGPGGWGGRGGF